MLKTIILISLLLLSGCKSISYRTMSVEEQMQFHRNYDGANGRFAPKGFYERLYGLDNK